MRKATTKQFSYSVGEANGQTAYFVDRQTAQAYADIFGAKVRYIKH